MRGKHGAASANRRANNAETKIEELHQLLAEAKARTAKNQRAADREPVLEARVAELERQLAESDGPHAHRAEELAVEIQAIKEAQRVDRQDTKRYLMRAIRASSSAWTYSDYERMAELSGEASKEHFVLAVSKGSSSFARNSGSFARTVKEDAKNKRQMRDPEAIVAYIEKGLEMLQSDLDASGDVQTYMVERMGDCLKEWVQDRSSSGEQPPSHSTRPSR
jgi:hypothetical protein